MLNPAITSRAQASLSKQLYGVAAAGGTIVANNTPVPRPQTFIQARQSAAYYQLAAAGSVTQVTNPQEFVLPPPPAD